MQTVRDHYDQFLGPLYSWIIGDFETAYRGNKAYFGELGIAGGKDARAIDLGSGPGCQSLPLAEAGFDVLAIDFCRELLDELEARRGDLPIRTVCGDLLDFESCIPGPVDLIVCMGDTLVHLPDFGTVSRLLGAVADQLLPGGRFIYAIRDYVDWVPSGADRFVPIRADDEQIFTCFLDYRDDVVHVHDILHRRDGGGWTTEISDYLKLRLDARQLDAELVGAGLSIADRRRVNGMITVVAQRPS